MKTMDCTLKRVLINVCGDCVTRSLSGSSCCKHHRWRLYHLEYSGNLLQSVFLSSLFVTGTFDRLPLLLLCEQHTFKMGVLLLCPPMCQHQCLLNGGPFYESLCINNEGGLPDVCQVLVDRTTDPLVGDLSPCVLRVQATVGVVGSTMQRRCMILFCWEHRF